MTSHAERRPRSCRKDAALLAQVVLVAYLLISAAVLFALVRRANALAQRASAAERRFDLLQQLSPALTAGAVDSTAATCARIVERLALLVPAQTVLCFYVEDDRLVLGARAGEGYAEFLREGVPYDGVSIVDAARQRGVGLAVGPAPIDVPEGVGIVDAASIDISGAGPAAGSRDRVWALALPLVLSRGRGSGPRVVGVLYVERPRATPFSTEQLRTATVVARLAADALERAHFADSVRRDARVDGLTGLMTPIAFRKRLRDEVSAGRDVALFFIDTDRFKLYNDTFGHAAGDALLRSLAATFQEIASKSAGFAGRNGGDEFCIALPDRTKDAAVEIAERVRRSVDESKMGGPVPITVSVGVAHHPVDVDPREPAPTDRLLEIADALMYEAKRSGRNRVEFLRLRAQSRVTAYPGEGPIPRR